MNRSRRTVVAVIACVVAFAAAVGLAAGLTPDPPGSGAGPTGPTPAISTPPTTAADLPEGQPPTIPFLREGVLHAHDRTYATRRLGMRGGNGILVSQGRTVVLGTEQQDGRRTVTRWWLAEPTGLVPLATTPTIAFPPVIASDGSLVAWVEAPSERQARVVAWDVAAGEVVRTRTFDGPAYDCCDLGPRVLLHGIDGAGHVYWSTGGGDRVSRWTPATGREVAVTGAPPGPPAAVTADALVFDRARNPWLEHAGVRGIVGRDGRFERSGATVPTLVGDTWSPDGSRVAYPSDPSGSGYAKNDMVDVFVADTTTGERLRMGLPPNTGVQVAWEDDGHVLVHAQGRRRTDWLLRCAVDDGACERVMPVSRATLVLPHIPSY